MATPSAEALSAYGQGQSYARLFQDHLEAGTCGIILERLRCSQDFATLNTLRSADSNDLQMQAWINSGDVALSPKDWHGVMVPDSTWATQPTFAWWYTAGIASIAGSMPQNNATYAYVLSIVTSLQKHAAAAPADFRSLPSRGGPFATIRRLQSLLDEIQPVEPFPQPTFAPTPLGYAKLGIYLSTLQELLDNPLALSRPESRSFGIAVIDQFEAIHQELRDGAPLINVRNILAGDIPADDKQVDAKLRGPISSVISTKWPLARQNALIMGMLIAQVGYNATVLKDLRYLKYFSSQAAQRS